MFAHGSGSSRHSVRNRFVVDSLRRDGFATPLLDLLTDLLTEREGHEDRATGRLRFDIGLPAERVAARWSGRHGRGRRGGCRSACSARAPARRRRRWWWRRGRTWCGRWCRAVAGRTWRVGR
ncbi:hypothetical protein [Saccharothrix sp. HUAS TT1]|uniref:hypothetical protein n=1 Tax=unclassified Saccharothrix TaxID=2593673 RepID=UPI00345C000A